MSSADEKMMHARSRPGRAVRNLEQLEGVEVLAVDHVTREPTLVGERSMDRLLVWEVHGRVASNPRCELVAEYRGTWDVEQRAWGTWVLVREHVPAREQRPARVVAFREPRAPRKRSSP